MRDFILKVWDILTWIPILWNDRDWDESFFLRIMEFKLRKMAHYFKKHGISCDNKRQAKQCKIAAALCKRIQDSDYNNGIEWVETGPGWFDGYFKRKEGFFGDPDLIDYENYMIRQDMNHLFSIFSKHLRTWWD